MGGREAIRGFSIQTLVVVLDALAPGNAHWTAVTLEPDSGNDKVDILWEFPGRSRAQQVKSSQNQISKSAVEEWANDLKRSRGADEYELILAGPVAQSVIEGSPFDGVVVPTPLAVDTLALLERAATKLDFYLTAKGMLPIPLVVRESVIAIVAANISDGAIRGQRVSRDEFEGWILRWVTAAYPQAITSRLSTNCEILWGEIRLEQMPLAADRAFKLTLSLTVINGGLTVAVVEWFLLKVSAFEREMRYEPTSLQLAAGRYDSLTEGGFGEFAVLPNSALNLWVTFQPSKLYGYKHDLWPLGPHRLMLYVKYAALTEPRLAKELMVTITEDHRAALSGTPRNLDTFKLGFV